MNNRLAIFASGSGTNADAIINYFRNSADTQVALIITNKANAGVIDVAKKQAVPYLVVGKEQLNNEVFLNEELKKHGINWIVLAGFLVMIPAFLVKDFQGKMINIHPALLPKFGGRGMYGKHVHDAVIASGENKSGITVHFVTEKYDEGKIIFQAETTVDNGETVLSLEEKIHRLEHHHYPVIIDKLIHHGI